MMVVFLAKHDAIVAEYLQFYSACMIHSSIMRLSSNILNNFSDIHLAIMSFQYVLLQKNKKF